MTDQGDNQSYPAPTLASLFREVGIIGQSFKDFMKTYEKRTDQADDRHHEVMETLQAQNQVLDDHTRQIKAIIADQESSDTKRDKASLLLHEVSLKVTELEASLQSLEGPVEHMSHNARKLLWVWGILCICSVGGSLFIAPVIENLIWGVWHLIIKATGAN